jgi:hypothetical protein
MFAIEEYFTDESSTHVEVFAKYSCKIFFGLRSVFKVVVSISRFYYTFGRFSIFLVVTDILYMRYLKVISLWPINISLRNEQKLD